MTAAGCPQGSVRLPVSAARWACRGSRRQLAEAGNRSSNRMANCPIAAIQSIGRFQRIRAFRIARYNRLAAASLLGKLPRVLRCRSQNLIRQRHRVGRAGVGQVAAVAGHAARSIWPVRRGRCPGRSPWASSRSTIGPAGSAEGHPRSGATPRRAPPARRRGETPGTLVTSVSPRPRRRGRARSPAPRAASALLGVLRPEADPHPLRWPSQRRDPERHRGATTTRAPAPQPPAAASSARPACRAPRPPLRCPGSPPG